MKLPGTHTNEKVREALHARGRMRMYCIASLVVLLLACLLVIYNTAQEYEDENEMDAAPKMVFIVAGDISYPAAFLARASGKLPFMRQLLATGSIFEKLNSNLSSGSALVKVLTGEINTTSLTLEGHLSFLRAVKEAEFKPALIASSSYFSATEGDTVGDCSHVGLLDTECVGSSCPGQNSAAYCNAAVKYATCSGINQYLTDDLFKGFKKAVENGADLIYIQADGLLNDGYTLVNRPPKEMLERFSKINLIDGLIGKVALSISKRTSTINENWLITMVSAGDNSYDQSPLFMAAYSKGMIVKLQQFAENELKTIANIFPTVLKWFSIELPSSSQTTNVAEAVGICSSGKKLKNCVDEEA